MNSISKVMYENKTEISGDFWYAKPIVMNLTTQQIFCQLSTESNGILKKTNSFFYTFNKMISVF